MVRHSEKVVMTLQIDAEGSTVIHVDIPGPFDSVSPRLQPHRGARLFSLSPVHS